MSLGTSSSKPSTPRVWLRLEKPESVKSSKRPYRLSSSRVPSESYLPIIRSGRPPSSAETSR